MLTQEQAQERVAAGQRYLDATLGGDWRKRVDPDMLDMAGSDTCVAAQAFGMPFGVAARHDANLRRVELGFWLTMDEYGYPDGTDIRDWSDWARAREQHGRDYRVLTQAWRDALRANLSQDPGSGVVQDTPCDHSWVAGSGPAGTTVVCAMCGEPGCELFGRKVN